MARRGMPFDSGFDDELATLDNFVHSERNVPGRPTNKYLPLGRQLSDSCRNITHLHRASAGRYAFGSHLFGLRDRPVFGAVSELKLRGLYNQRKGDRL